MKPCLMSNVTLQYIWTHGTTVPFEYIINNEDAFAQSALLGSLDFFFYDDFGLESLSTDIRTSYCIFLFTVEVAEYFHSCI